MEWIFHVTMIKNRSGYNKSHGMQWIHCSRVFRDHWMEWMDCIFQSIQWAIVATPVDGLDGCIGRIGKSIQRRAWL